MTVSSHVPVFGYHLKTKLPQIHPSLQEKLKRSEAPTRGALIGQNAAEDG